jgi:hypothetical protein
MKISNMTKVYLSVTLLFISTFLLTGAIFKGYKTNNFFSYNIILKAFFVVFAILCVLKYSKKVNHTDK